MGSHPSPIGVALIDDDAMALAYLQSYFSSTSEIQVLSATRSARRLLDFLQSHQVDVLIAAVHMEGMGGVELTREALRISPRTRVILLTTVDTDDSLLRGLGAGASGFLLKSTPAEEVLSAVRTVHAGDKVVAPTPTARLIDYALASVHSADGSVSLSDREYDVLRLLCEGASNRRIASRLSIAEATVKTHVSVLLSKTGTSSRLELVVWAFKHGYASGRPAPPASGRPAGTGHSGETGGQAGSRASSEARGAAGDAAGGEIGGETDDQADGVSGRASGPEPAGGLAPLPRPRPT